MSQLLALLERAHRVDGEGGLELVMMLTQRRASRPRLAQAATAFRRAADLLDQAAALLPTPRTPDA